VPLVLAPEVEEVLEPEEVGEVLEPEEVGLV
jgi:hypothetical protein